MNPWLAFFLGLLCGGFFGCLAMAIVQAARDPFDIDMSETRMEDVLPDGWLPWQGGARPVELDTLVVVEFRDGSVTGPSHAAMFVWVHLNCPGDIVAYRIHQQD